MFKKVVLIFSILVVVLIIWKWDQVLAFIRKDAKTINTAEVKILLKDDPTADELAKVLVAEGVVENEDVILETIKKNDMQTSFSGGKYLILSGTRITELITGFQKGPNGEGNQELKVKVSIGRCRDIADLARQVSNCIAADSASIITYIHQDEVLQKYGFSKAQIPAMFFPGEFEMYFDLNPEEFVAQMAENFKEFWNEDRKTKMRKLGFNAPSQVVTLGSIVYSEQGKVPEEWSTIAALYLNRLNKGMRLQSDPTFKFCWGNQLDGVQRLRAVHRNVDCAYNTYKINGLPPGPICLVPKEVIDAVLEPDDVNYLFMCAQPNFSGKHDFTASDIEHVRNAKIYQKWLKENSIE